MKLVYALPLVVFSIFMVGYTFEHANAAIGSNTALILEGSGFAVSENSIQTSQIDFAISTGDVASGKANIVVEDGFITLEDQDFIAMGISGQSLRDGKYLRLSGDAVDSLNFSGAVNSKPVGVKPRTFQVSLSQGHFVFLCGSIGVVQLKD